MKLKKKKNSLGFNIYIYIYIYISKNIEKAIDNKLFVCRIIIDLQKAFDTVDHNIIDLGSKAFPPIFLTINNLSQQMKKTLPQKLLGMVYHRGQFWDLFFLVYINDLDNAKKFFQPLHFADDTFLLNNQSRICKIKRLNKDLTKLSFWLNAIKIVLGV